MENYPLEMEVKNLVKELSAGREVAKQLQILFNNAHESSSSSSSSSTLSRELLLERILTSFDHALSMLTNTPAISDSPHSLVGSDDSDPDFKDQPCRKRNKGAVPRWNEKIKVSPERGIEGQLDDGYCWRKYGQKDILGAKHPRGYYRCSYRHAQGCLATKQVQKSDDDPTTFEITYRRKHTCTARANTSSPPGPGPMPDPQQEDPNPIPLLPQNEPLFNIQTSLRVITQDLCPNESPSFHPFNFSSSSSINPQNNPMFSYGNDILGNYNPISTNDMSDNNYGELIPNLHNSDHEFGPIVEAITSTTNSPTIASTHFPFGSSGFGPGFGFDNSRFYP